MADFIVQNKLAAFGDKVFEKLQDKTVDHLFGEKKDGTSPFGGHDGRLANIERKMVIQELIATDPILKRISPQKILQAYEQIVRLAPQVARQKDVVRAILRQLVHSSAMEPFTADQLVKLDKGIIDR